MSLSMYQASIPVFIRHLEILSQILDKGLAYAEEKKIDPSVFINARLAPDMLPLSRQIQIASDGTKGFAARISSSEIPSFPDTETTFSELQERITKTIDFLKTIKPAQVDNTEDKTVSLKIRGQERDVKGQPYLLGFVLPNLYFHVTTAYAILRHNGVPLGKMDFLGNF